MEKQWSGRKKLLSWIGAAVLGWSVLVGLLMLIAIIGGAFDV
nr:hypothetical protein 16 [Balneolaceae bacterium]